MNQGDHIHAGLALANWINTYINPFGILATFIGFIYTIKQINSIKSNQEAIAKALHLIQIKECISLINEAQQNLQFSQLNYQLNKRDAALHHLSLCRNKLISGKHRLSGYGSLDSLNIQKIMAELSMLYDKILKITSKTPATTIEARNGDYFELIGLIQQWNETVGEQFIQETS